MEFEEETKKYFKMLDSFNEHRKKGELDKFYESEAYFFSIFLIEGENSEISYTGDINPKYPIEKKDFYKSVNNLEKRGLIKGVYNRDKKWKRTVKLTEHGKIELNSLKKLLE